MPALPRNHIFEGYYHPNLLHQNAPWYVFLVHLTTSLICFDCAGACGFWARRWFGRGTRIRVGHKCQCSRCFKSNSSISFELPIKFWWCRCKIRSADWAGWWPLSHFGLYPALQFSEFNKLCLETLDRFLQTFRLLLKALISVWWQIQIRWWRERMILWTSIWRMFVSMIQICTPNLFGTHWTSSPYLTGYVLILQFITNWPLKNPLRLGFWAFAFCVISIALLGWKGRCCVGKSVIFGVNSWGLSSTTYW